MRKEKTINHDKTFVLKRKLKQRWSIFPLITTERTIASHLKSMNTKKMTTHEVGKPGPGMEDV